MKYSTKINRGSEAAKQAGGLRPGKMHLLPQEAPIGVLKSKPTGSQ